MKEETGGDGESEEVDPLRMEVAQLAQVCAEMREELMTHRHYLEQCLEVRQVVEQCLELREGVQDILVHRETFKQCIAMEDSIQAVIGGAKIIGELGDRQLEFDISLAGVSDNTARHGKAISTLAEQQKRTTSTLDAVVRAVKRLARSRSRSRGSVGEHFMGNDEQVAGVMARQISGNDVDEHAYAPTAMQELGCVDTRPERLESQPSVESQPRLLDAPLEDWGNLVDELAGKYVVGADGGDWIGAPGWPLADSAGLETNVLAGLQGPLGYVGAGATSEEDMRGWSGSSSCGSERRSLRTYARPHHVQRGSRPESRGSSGKYRGSAGLDGGIPDTLLGGPGDLSGKAGQAGTRQSGDQLSTAPVASPEMANCVQGVLARIEEALTKLDSNGPQEAEPAVLGSGRSGRGPSRGNRPRPVNGDRRPTNRPHSARGTATARGSTPRSTTPRVARAGATPYGHAANSWA